MHIPDGFISMPINVGAAVVSASACAAALARTRATMGEKQVPLVGLTSSFIFAAQMLNFPVAMGTSGHFLGALLAAALLGPLESCLILAVVLAIQCLFFADGGLLVLGTNVLNMGVVGGMGGWLVLVGLRAILPRGRSAFLGAVAVASWASVMLAAAACSAELVFSGVEPASHVFSAMLGVHALIGIGEGLITTTVVAMVLASRPDLVAQAPRLAGASS
ncbi:MAG: energy-coupling factor ABC transporter permease [Planctomycetaceae bacterium]|nr:cobalamin biosynthesis protein CbiM [Planctomycetota bacterium]NUO16556.1 energy-coupling factor ABC transporter permease [Planctomycetaceae bacterium]GIK51817.1 MAG: cobalamin biosynthesis protein CbiM [Planctomycetota bacterium]